MRCSSHAAMTGWHVDPGRPWSHALLHRVPGTHIPQAGRSAGTPPAPKRSKEREDANRTALQAHASTQYQWSAQFGMAQALTHHFQQTGGTRPRVARAGQSHGEHLMSFPQAPCTSGWRIRDFELTCLCCGEDTRFSCPGRCCRVGGASGWVVPAGWRFRAAVNITPSLPNPARHTTTSPSRPIVSRQISNPARRGWPWSCCGKFPRGSYFPWDPP